MATATARDYLSEATTTPPRRPGVMVIYGLPGIGKSCALGNVPGTIALPFAEENRWALLKEQGVVPNALAILPPVTSWKELLGTLQALRDKEHSHKAILVDTLGCAETLCFEEVTNREYNGVKGEKGFGGFQRGYELAQADWREFLHCLDQLRDQRQMSVFLIAHSKIYTFKNPEGPDYDRYIPAMHKHTWALTSRWADAVLFANYYVVVETKKGGKAKGYGGQERIWYTEHHASYEAKSIGLPPEIPMGNSGKEAWTNLKNELVKARKGN